jgi:hypothetical protein
MSPREVARRPKAKAPNPVDVANLPSIQLSDLENETEAGLKARGAAYVAAYVQIEHAPTILLKNIAAVIVALRFKYNDPMGRSFAYREAASDMYRLANVPKDSQDNTQKSVRWHVGNLLREVLPEDELKALPLKTASPLQRQQDRKARNAALLRTVNASVEVASSTPKKTKAKEGDSLPAPTGQPVKATADHLRLASAGLDVFKQLDASVIDEHMTDGQRAKLDAHLEELQKVVAKLRRHTRKRRSGA